MLQLSIKLLINNSSQLMKVVKQKLMFIGVERWYLLKRERLTTRVNIASMARSFRE